MQLPFLFLALSFASASLASPSCNGVNPTNPNICRGYGSNNLTKAQFNLNLGWTFTVWPYSLPLIMLSSDTNVYYQRDGNLVM